MSIYIGEPVVVSDMQGPCPKGFHVPLMSEWQAIYKAYKGFGLNGNKYFSSYLKLPRAGYRDYNMSVSEVDSSGNYWSSTALDETTAVHLRFSPSSINPEISDYRSRGCTVRCIQDSPTIPTASWTTLYQGSGSAGIFRNQTDGLISISSDGTTWYTLMDKNLGATTVYNYGDTFTEDNCGNVFQRGNNYAFPGTKSSSSITSSSTKVDVTGYGPGNYYESSTWITKIPRQSSASDGNNLRGGVSQGTSTKSVEVKNIYIGKKPYDGKELCFTAQEANSTVTLNKYDNPTTVTLETSTDGETWSTYTFGTTITLSNVGDKVYWRNTSTTTTGFSKQDNFYRFSMTGTIAASGDLNYLINKNSTTTLVGKYCFSQLFNRCSSLTSAPELPATTLTEACYAYLFGSTSITTSPKLPATTLAVQCYITMFWKCTALNTLPKLPATTLTTECYKQMFQGCTSIKLSSTQTGEYQTAYRIPTTGTGTTATSALGATFYGTGGTFTGTPTINTTYYTSNTVV